VLVLERVPRKLWEAGCDAPRWFVLLRLAASRLRYGVSGGFGRQIGGHREPTRASIRHVASSSDTSGAAEHEIDRRGCAKPFCLNRDQSHLAHVAATQSSSRRLPEALPNNRRLIIHPELVPVE